MTYLTFLKFLNLGSIRVVAGFFSLLIVYFYVLSKARTRAALRLGERHGCQAPRWKLEYKLPLALDILKKGFAAGRKKKLLGLFTEYFGLMGHTIEVCILGGKGFATMDPENIENILSAKFDDFHLGPRSMAMKAMIGEGIFTQDGHAWKHSRELLRQQFSRMHYQNLTGFREHVDDLMAMIRRSSGVIDLQPLFYRLTLNTTIAMILGQSADNFRQDTGDIFTKSFDRASLVTATRVRLGDLYFLFAPKGFHEACRTVKNLTRDFVKDALDEKTRSPSDSTSETFIQYLNEAYQNDILVRDQILNIVIAGRDTTASTLSYAFRLLTSHPTILQKLRREVNSVLAQDPEITRASIQKMPYLRNVINETLRLYPPVPINTRFCRQTTTLPHGGGPDGTSPLLIRAGMPVAYSVYHMQRRPDIYGPDALSFRPERWEGDELSHVKWAYLPFNGGPRVCLGKDFALMLASYTIARMLQTFSRVEGPPGEVLESIGEERQHLTLTLSNAGGCRVVVER